MLRLRPRVAALPSSPGPLSFVVGVAAMFAAESPPTARVELGPRWLRPALTNKLLHAALVAELCVVAALRSSLVLTALAALAGAASYAVYRSKALRLAEWRLVVVDIALR